MPLVDIDIEKNPNAYGMTPDRSHLRQASRLEDTARAGLGRWRSTLQGVRLLFGAAVPAPIERAVEDVTEPLQEAIYHLREHLSEVEANLRSQSAARHRAEALLEAAYLDEVKRAKKAKRDLAPWAADAAAIVEVPF